MSFFKDILSGGGRLYKKVVPKEIRKLVPKEISPGGFNPGRDWFGIDLDGTLAAEAKAKQAQKVAAENAAAMEAFNQSTGMSIPGMNGLMGAGQVPGPVPPQAPGPSTTTGQLGGRYQGDPAGQAYPMPTGMGQLPVHARGVVADALAQWRQANMADAEWAAMLQQRQAQTPVQLPTVHGPYGAQALQMSGLLGRKGIGTPTMGYQGLLGGSP